MADLTNVLELINTARVAGGVNPLSEIPRGNSTYSFCPLANAFKEFAPKVSVSASSVNGLPRERAYSVASALNSEVVECNGTARIELPYELSQFVSAFDQGAFPHLKSY